MEPAVELLYDHEVLRGKLTLLESTLPHFRTTPVTCKLLLDQLATCLRRHTEREERLLLTLKLSSLISREVLEQICDAHENHRMSLAVLHDLLADGGQRAEEDMRVQAQEFIRDLNALMQREEIEWFPMLSEGALLQMPQATPRQTVFPIEDDMALSMVAMAYCHGVNDGGRDGTHQMDWRRSP